MMPTVRSLVTRALSPLIRGAEGQPRPGPYYLPITGGWLPAGTNINWWQQGYSPVGGERSAIVEACIGAYSQTVSMCPGDHWRANKKGGRTRVTTSALSRILRRPNDYESISDFLLNLTRSLYLTGNAYAMALRNDRFEIDELHLMDANQSGPQVIRATNDSEANGNIFYQLGGNSVIEARLARNEAWTREQLLVPARDVLHVRLHTNGQYPRPLVGETPLAAAWGDLMTYHSIKAQQNSFFQNQARPSAVLTTDLNLDRDQVQALRDRWNEQSKGLHAGGVPILTSGLKVQPWTAPAAAKDMQVAELLKMSVEQVALVFRVPLQILGIANAPFSSTSKLMEFWLASGLGFCLNHIE